MNTRPRMSLEALLLASVAPGRTSLDEEPPRLVSAFYGLDNAFLKREWRICAEAPGADGIPVTFTRQVVGSRCKGADVFAIAFTVATRSEEREDVNFLERRTAA
ncbi:MAG: hypothetical protein GY822_24050 [Deltaproteobacteria bacterium]|nr:hypothetical protein [Deltaproteobacteria bacterium]